jgi:hypothetical protein
MATLLELGARLREAQAHLAGDDLRRLTRDRQQVIRGLAREARSLAAARGRPLSATAGRQVEETLNAVLADPDAATAVATGRLIRSLEYAGVGPIDASGAVAGPSAGSSPQPDDAPTPDTAGADHGDHAVGREDALDYGIGGRHSSDSIERGSRQARDNTWWRGAKACSRHVGPGELRQPAHRGGPVTERTS